MSSKQMAYAANAGTRLTFHFADERIHGYLVGMDDYHWLVAEVQTSGDQDSVTTHLVHKGSVRRVRIHKEDLLSAERPAVQAEINGVGGPFFAWCEKFLSRKPQQQDA